MCSTSGTHACRLHVAAPMLQCKQATSGPSSCMPGQQAHLLAWRATSSPLLSSSSSRALPPRCSRPSPSICCRAASLACRSPTSASHIAVVWSNSAGSRQHSSCMSGALLTVHGACPCEAQRAASCCNTCQLLCAPLAQRKVTLTNAQPVAQPCTCTHLRHTWRPQPAWPGAPA
jgi:hypothetical protein